MLNNTNIAMFSVAITLFVTDFQSSHAQMPLPVFATPSPVVIPSRRLLHHHGVVPMQVSYPAYFAPQVPTAPFAIGPVPTMSAYYIPTVPVSGVYPVAVVPVRKFRRHAVSVAPIMIHPVYWSPH